MNAPILSAACAALFFASVAWAGPGHDHSHDDAPAAIGEALPRFAAVSETFELVGVLDGKHLVLYLDRYDDGSPVKDAVLELELDGVKLPVRVRGEGEFEAELARIPAPGMVAVAATILAGEETDLLAGEFALADAAETSDVQGMSKSLLWGGLAIVGLLALGAGIRWASRRTGGAA